MLACTRVSSYVFFSQISQLIWIQVPSYSFLHSQLSKITCEFACLHVFLPLILVIVEDVAISV